MKLSLAVITILSFPNFSVASWRIEVFKGKTSLPKAMTDMTASVIDDFIYIVGGCKNNDGLIPVDGQVAIERSGNFYCPHVSNEIYQYSPLTDTFVSMHPAPRARHRHAAVAINGRIWLLGGYTEEYEVIHEVDVFDPATNSWTTPGVLDWITTDLAAFSHENVIYYGGGYINGSGNLDNEDRKYATKEIHSFHSIDALVNSNEETFEIRSKYEFDMREARGDVHAVKWGPWAYVAGGFASNSDNATCNPLNSVELFDLGLGSHGLAAPLEHARGDKSLVAMNNILFAIGGLHKENCDIERLPVAAVVEQVETLDVTNPLMSSWEYVGDIKSDKFRFTTVAFPKLNKMYAFGGVTFYDESCNCYPSSRDVMHYKYYDVESEEGDNGDGGLTDFEMFSIVAFVCAFVGVVAKVIYNKRKNISGEKCVEESPVIDTTEIKEGPEII